jgi:hypothetical protein
VLVQSSMLARAVLSCSDQHRNAWAAGHGGHRNALGDSSPGGGRAGRGDGCCVEEVPQAARGSRDTGMSACSPCARRVLHGVVGWRPALVVERETSVRVSSAVTNSRHRVWLTVSRVAVRVLDGHVQKCRRHISREERDRVALGRERLVRRLLHLRRRGGGQENVLFSWRRFLATGGLTGGGAAEEEVVERTTMSIPIRERPRAMSTYSMSCTGGVAARRGGTEARGYLVSGRDVRLEQDSV